MGAVRLSLSIPLTLAAWFATAGALTALAEPSEFVVVIGPRDRSLAAMAGADARLVDAGTGFLRVAGDTPGFVRRLYAHGALLVLPARAGGCLALTRTPRG